jgi:hypothetical protein
MIKAAGAVAIRGDHWLCTARLNNQEWNETTCQALDKEKKGSCGPGDSVSRRSNKQWTLASYVKELNAQLRLDRQQREW